MIRKKKPLNQLTTDGTYLNVIKAIYDKLTANIILNGEKLKVFTPRSEARQRCRLLPFLFNIVLEILVTDTRQDIEGIQIGREVVTATV